MVAAAAAAAVAAVAAGIFGGRLRKKRSWYYCVGTKFTWKISSYEESSGLISSYEDSSDSRENKISYEEIKCLP
jgi:hypothetical protein